LTECPQVEICEKSFENIEEKFKVANHRIGDLETKTEEINRNNNTLAKMEVLISLQREDSLRRDKSIDEMNKTQIEITNTLVTLTNSIKKTDESVDKLDKKVDANDEKLNRKVDDISKDNNINILQVIKYIILTLTSVGVGIWLTKVFGS